MQLEASKLQFLKFADDMVLVAEEEKDPKRNEVLNEVDTKWKNKFTGGNQGQSSTERGRYMSHA